MKKLLASLALGVSLMFSSLPAYAAPADQPNTVTVTGRAEVAVAPDIAYVSAGVVTSATDVTAAKSENDAVMKRVLDAVATAGIDKDQVRTSGFSVQPQYKYSNRGEEAPILTGYKVQNMVTITVQDLNNLGPVIDAAAAAGANQIQGVRFAVKNEDKVRDALLTQAVLDGRHKAGIIASALDQRLGEAMNVSATGLTHTTNEVARYMKADAASSVPISAGTMTIALDVNMVFRLN